ncbi:FixH family protein [Dasania sp. GY-MA-18]|uniref:FixH family protein n=1 Tax=Dasania phycosphaerae TaxID=2950436 RepID=A0A9J6RPQ6_9GAMM|nr:MULTISPECIES: FixH family protein [Dasania]MCR8923661.1 FixH family protein [Dasania sp. GY-MA-18]MCZ0866095.1 FixH family protein [Dasania phycosphaerae]MCZ0869819.1 FixH family protein [Dasania phycosphaerae]
MNTPDNDKQPAPWYQQFWLWFLIFFPALAIVAGVITIIIAVKNEDSLVRDDYYKAGLAINSDLAHDKFARQHNIQATLTLDSVTGGLQLALQADLDSLPNKLQLDFIHPAAQTMDFGVELIKRHDNLYIGQLKQGLTHRWYLQLSDQSSPSSDDKSWRLSTELDASTNDAERISLSFTP